MVIVPKDGTRTIDFNLMKETLKRPYNGNDKDFESVQWMFEGASKYLDGNVKVQPAERVLYTTCPRSGNSFLRRYFEQVSGVVTGCDINVNYIPNVNLQQIGFKGEQVVDDSIWICKTHYPLTIPEDLTQYGGKALCCVRNPID